MPRRKPVNKNKVPVKDLRRSRRIQFQTIKEITQQISKVKGATYLVHVPSGDGPVEILFKSPSFEMHGCDECQEMFMACLAMKRCEPKRLPSHLLEMLDCEESIKLLEPPVSAFMEEATTSVTAHVKVQLQSEIMDSNEEVILIRSNPDLLQNVI